VASTDRVCLLAIVGLAGGLRVWGIDFGLPHTLARPDEDATVAIALRFFSRQFNPGFFDWPSLFMYIVTVAFIVYFQIGRVTGRFPYEVTFLAEAGKSQAPLRFITRGLSAAAGVITVGAVHAIGLRLFDRTTALIGALFLAVAALHVRDSHFGVTDVAATCWVTLSFLFTVKYAQSGRRRDAIVSAILAGLAASTKYNAGLVVLPGLWAIAIGSPGWRSRGALATIYVTVAIVAFFCGTPYALIDRPAFLAALGGISARFQGGHAALAGPGWVVHLSSSLRYGMGLPLVGAGILGLALFIWSDRRYGVLFAVFPLAYYAFIGAGETAFARYIIPVVPFLCLSAAHAIVQAAGLVGRLTGRAQMIPAAAWTLAIAAATPSLVAAAWTDLLLARTDNRLIAADWIRRTYPDGVSIAQTGTVAGQVQMTTAADPDAAATYRPLKFEPGSGRFFLPDDSDGSPELILVEECPLPYCRIPDEWFTVLRRGYHIERVFPAYDTTSQTPTYDRDDDFYLPLSGFNAVLRPGPNITVYGRNLHGAP